MLKLELFFILITKKKHEKIVHGIIYGQLGILFNNKQDLKMFLLVNWVIKVNTVSYFNLHTYLKEDGVFDLRKIFDLRNFFAVPKNFLKSKIHCINKIFIYHS